MVLSGRSVSSVIQLATGFRSQTIARRLLRAASIATTPLPAKGSNTTWCGLVYARMCSPTTFHVFRDQYLCHTYIAVWGSGGICLLMWSKLGGVTLPIRVPANSCVFIKRRVRFLSVIFDRFH